MILETLVEEVAQRLQLGRGAAPSSLLQNRWLQLGAAVAIGYLIGRTRGRLQLGPFGRTLATAAVTTLVRTAMHPGERGPAAPN